MPFSSLSYCILTVLPSLAHFPRAVVGAFPELIEIDISNSLVTAAGTLPVSWGSPAAFPNLQLLGLFETKLHGSVPSFKTVSSPPFCCTTALSALIWVFFGLAQLPWYLPSCQTITCQGICWRPQRLLVSFHSWT